MSVHGFKKSLYCPVGPGIPKPRILHSRKKNNDILNFAGKWMEVENIILSEVTQKGNYHMYSLIGGF